MLILTDRKKNWGSVSKTTAPNRERRGRCFRYAFSEAKLGSKLKIASRGFAFIGHELVAHFLTFIKRTQARFFERADMHDLP
jgi:hypothetical protein